MEYGNLALTRKPHEPLVFQYRDEHGNQQEIELQVNKVSGQQVRLSIAAPQAVNVARKELLEDVAF